MKPFIIGLSAFFIAATPALASTDAHLSAIQARGDTDITNRVTSLTTLVTSVSSAKRLTSAQENELITEMQGEITGLTSLKTSLDGDTTVADATTDFKNIFAQHYIYAFYIPRINRILAADDQADATAILLALVPKIQADITTAQSKGNDVTALQSSLTDMQSQLTSAQSTVASVTTSLLPLSASGYPSNANTVQEAAASLKSSRAQLQTAHVDANAIVNGLRSLLGTSAVQ